MRDNLDLNGGRTAPRPQEREREARQREKGESERGEGAIKSEGERLLRIPRQCHYDRRAGAGGRTVGPQEGTHSGKFQIGYD